MFLRECSEEVLEDLLLRDETDLLVFTSPCLSPSLLCLSAVVGVALPKSSDVPGVRGVLPEAPKDANAPEPNPNAEDAPLPGDVTPEVVKGVMPLNGLLLLLKEPSPPNRFAD